MKYMQGGPFPGKEKNSQRSNFKANKKCFIVSLVDPANQTASLLGIVRLANLSLHIQCLTLLHLRISKNRPCDGGGEEEAQQQQATTTTKFMIPRILARFLIADRL